MIFVFLILYFLVSPVLGRDSETASGTGEEPIKLYVFKYNINITTSERENMTRCKHESCGAAEKVWLPYESAGRSRGLKSHQYCIHCGVVKNISPNKAKAMGYYTNVLARMPITKVQMRLIIKELDNMDFDDTYSMTKSAQEKVFVSVVQKYCKCKASLRRAYST